MNTKAIATAALLFCADSQAWNIDQPSRYGNRYGDDSNSYQLYYNGKYMGNLNDNRYDDNSVSNPYGRYGNPYSQDSINNPYRSLDD